MVEKRKVKCSSVQEIRIQDVKVFSYKMRSPCSKVPDFHKSLSCLTATHGLEWTPRYEDQVKSFGKPCIVLAIFCDSTRISVTLGLAWDRSLFWAACKKKLFKKLKPLMTKSNYPTFRSHSSSHMHHQVSNFANLLHLNQKQDRELSKSVCRRGTWYIKLLRHCLLNCELYGINKTYVINLRCEICI